MNPLVERVIGLALIVGSLFGLLFNIAGLVMVPRLEESLRQGAIETLTALDGTLAVTADGLVVVSASLDNAAETVDTVESTTRGVADAVEDTLPLFDTMATLTGEELPNTIATTQQSLGAAQDGALAIDVMMTTITTLPLLGLPSYNPRISLHDSLENVSTSLDPLAGSFSEIESSINVAGENLTQVNSDVLALADNLAAVDQTITDAKQVTGQFQTAVEQQQAVVASLQESLVPGITWASRALAMILLWLAIAQVGLLSQGLEMVGRSRRKANQEALD